ncbi:zinc finger and SCAN domain-containing protein 12-like [Myripristis murdjan]|uniref:Zinc finger and SCAN domain-containing protein 12-like n=1 Tax=Myripristis murdjan TaxID=586833 RepID=A0A667WCB2_9TELE|nr:zinc finger and SCAN domain-containing protein 12-like [Myripristis murdjan]
MSKIEMLRLLITERLTAAAEEIFGVFGRALAEYEEEISRSKLEIDRQRRLLDLTVQPRVELRGAALLEQQEWSSGLELEPPPPPRIKEEEEELWTGNEEGQQDDGIIKFTVFQTASAEQDQVSPVIPSYRSQCLDGRKLDPQPGTSAPPPPHTEPVEEVSGGSDTAGNDQLAFSDCGEATASPSEEAGSYTCSVCGKVFVQRGFWARHVRLHLLGGRTVDKSYRCDICGKRLTRLDGFQKHLRVHTGEKPYSCGECGKRFSDNSNYKRHIRTHTGTRAHRGRGCRKPLGSALLRGNTDV